MVRLWRKVDKTGDCWIWTGSVDTGGHGQIRDNQGRLQMVHRVAWEDLVGPIEEGHVLHHLDDCSTKRCVRPDHLESKTHADHSRDHQNEKTHCAKGHPFDTRDRRQRVCSICRRDRWRAWKARQAQPG